MTVMLRALNILNGFNLPIYELVSTYPSSSFEAAFHFRRRGGGFGERLDGRFTLRGWNPSCVCGDRE